MQSSTFNLVLTFIYNYAHKKAWSKRIIVMVKTFLLLSTGWTPLLRCAAVNGNLSVARVLIHHGANVSSMDRDGKTVLMNAALNGFDPLVKLLVKKGASVATKSEHGKTALDFARSFDRDRVVQYLHEHMEAYKKAQNEKKLNDARKERKESLERTIGTQVSKQDLAGLDVPSTVLSTQSIELEG